MGTWKGAIKARSMVIITSVLEPVAAVCPLTAVANVYCAWRMVHCVGPSNSTIEAFITAAVGSHLLLHVCCIQHRSGLRSVKLYNVLEPACARRVCMKVMPQLKG